MSDIYIEDYSPKSFVVRGDTREYKDSLKTLGGKWNSSLTDKQSGDKFGAWLFWGDKKKEIVDWIEKGCNSVDSTKEIKNTPFCNTASSSDLSIKTLEVKIDFLTNMLKALCDHQGLELRPVRKVIAKQMIQTPPLDCDIDSDDDVEPVKTRRLLGGR